MVPRSGNEEKEKSERNVGQRFKGFRNRNGKLEDERDPFIWMEDDDDHDDAFIWEDGDDSEEIISRNLGVGSQWKYWGHTNSNKRRGGNKASKSKSGKNGRWEGSKSSSSKAGRDGKSKSSKQCWYPGERSSRKRRYSPRN